MLAGCAAAPLPPLAEEPEIVAARAAGPPLAVSIAVPPARMRPAPLPEDSGPCGDSAEGIRDLVAEALRAAGVAREARGVPEAAAGSDPLAEAWRDGQDLLLEIEVSRLEVSYLGTNGWWWPNLLLWIHFVWPAWLVPDEDYAMRIEASARLLATASGAEVWRGRVATEVRRRLNDFQRGMVLFALLRVPAALGPENWRAVAEEIGPSARRRFAVSLAAAIASGLRAAAGTSAYAERTRQDLAVVAGCGRYFSPALPDLKFPPEDARAMAAWLRGAGFRGPCVRLMVDEEATRDRVLGEIRGFLAARARPGDRVVISFAGYAGADDEGGPALLLHDADPRRPRETGIPLALLAESLRAIPGADVLLLVDAGLGGPPAERWAGGGLAPPDPEGLAAGLEALAARPRTAVVWACAPGEGAGEAVPRRRGLLTLNWLRAVERARDLDRDGVVSVAEALVPAGEGVRAHAALTGRRQAPRVCGSEAAARIALPRSGAGGGAGSGP